MRSRHDWDLLMEIKNSGSRRPKSERIDERFADVTKPAKNGDDPACPAIDDKTIGLTHTSTVAACTQEITMD